MFHPNTQIRKPGTGRKQCLKVNTEFNTQISKQCLKVNTVLRSKSNRQLWLFPVTAQNLVLRSNVDLVWRKKNESREDREGKIVNMVRHECLLTDCLALTLAIWEVGGFWIHPTTYLLPLTFIDCYSEFTVQTIFFQGVFLFGWFFLQFSSCALSCSQVSNVLDDVLQNARHCANSHLARRPLSSPSTLGGQPPPPLRL